MKFNNQDGQPSARKNDFMKSCSAGGTAAAKSKNIAAPSSEEQAIMTIASSMSIRFASMDLPPMKPRWKYETGAPTQGSIAHRMALARSRLSVLVTLRGVYSVIHSNPRR